MLFAPPEPPPTTVAPAEVVATIKSTDWIYKPTSSQMNNYLAPSVRGKPGHRTGEVVLKCLLHAEGTVSNCSVIDQTNPKVAFGEAAVRASILFKIRPPTLNGAPVDNSWVLIPLSFDITVLQAGEQGFISHSGRP